MTQVINTTALPGETSRQFEGHLYGDVPVSFFVSHTPPGGGPSLHIHPYTEVFVIHSGRLSFVVGDTSIEATAGQIVIVPPGTPHRFTNTSDVVVQHTDIHPSDHMETVWLDV